MNEKAGFEIILKSCKHVTHVAVGTMSMITIRMIASLNSFIMLTSVNTYLLRYSLFLQFSQTLYNNWITWCTECCTICKIISKLKTKEQNM